MQQRTLLYLSAILLLLGATSTAFAEVPDSIGYQGMLTSGGSPVTTTVTVVFSIYDDETSGTLLWSESQSVTPDANGLYSVYLGGGTLLSPMTPLSEEIFDGPNRWLEIQVESDPPMARMPLVTMPYAYRVATVDGSTGGIISGDVSIQSDLFVSGKATIGQSHTNTGQWAFVAGFNNGALEDYSAVGGGYENVANSYYSVIAGGHGNTAIGMSSAVGGGEHNYLRGDAATIGGGSANYTYLSFTTVSGGKADTAYGSYNTIGGGEQNKTNDSYSTIGGGFHNTANGNSSTVAGGYENIASGNNATVAGGVQNTAAGNQSVCGGGYLNSANAIQSTISGGENSTTDAYSSTIGGGYGHHITGHAGTISGGQYHRVGGQYSCIPGGERDTVNGNHSMAFGYGVYTSRNNYIVFYDGDTRGFVRINRDDRDDPSPTSHPLRIGMDGNTGNGAYLSEGGAWMPGSSRTFKTNFQPINAQELLAKISSLPVESWEYKGGLERHIGPVAEDFVAEFDVGPILPDGTRENKYLSPTDVAGVALAAVKELNRKNQELEKQITELQALVKMLLDERK